jgi:hypothetical protein
MHWGPRVSYFETWGTLYEANFMFSGKNGCLSSGDDERIDDQWLNRCLG